MTKLRNIFIVLLFITTTKPVLSQTPALVKTHDDWKWLSPLPHGGNFSCVKMVSPDTIIAGGYNGYSVIYYSFNGGSTWSIANTPVAATRTVSKIVMLADSKKGYALAGTMLLRTNDGGKNWSEYTLDQTDFINTSDFTTFFPTGLNDFNLSNVVYQPNNIAVAYGTKNCWGCTDETIVTTFNHGVTIHPLMNKKTNGDPILYNFNGQPYDYLPYNHHGFTYFSDSLNGWFVTNGVPNTVTGGYDKVVLRTVNQGQNWSIVHNFGDVTQARGIYFKNATEGYLFNHDNVLKTINAGTSWTVMNTLPHLFSRIEFINNNTAIGTAGIEFFITKNSGTTWTKLEQISNIGDFEFIGNDTIVLKSNTHVVFSFDAGNTWQQPYLINSEPLGELFTVEPRHLRFASADIALYKGVFSFNGGRSFPKVPAGSAALMYPLSDRMVSSGFGYMKYNPTSITSSASIWDISDDALTTDKRKQVAVLVTTNTTFNSMIFMQEIGSERWVQKNYMPYVGGNQSLSYPIFCNGFQFITINKDNALNSVGGINRLDRNFGFHYDKSISQVSASGISSLSAPAPVNGADLYIHPGMWMQTIWAVGDGIYRNKLGSWENLGNPGSTLNAVSFDSVSNGVAAGENCEIYNTINSGDFWTTSYQPTVKVSGLSGAYFTDDYTGYAISATTLYQTKDGGFTWTVVVNKSFGGNNKLFVQDDNSYAFVLGMNGVLYKVDISGKTAEQIAGSVRDFYFLNEDDGYYISSQQFFTTSNGGEDWTDKHTFTGISPNAVSFSDSLNGYVGGDQGKLLKTVDGGLSWDDISVAGVNINGLSVISADTVFVGADKGTFFYSHNGGTNWTPRATGTQDSLHHIKFFNSREGYLVTSGGFIKTTDGGQTFSLYEAPIKNNGKYMAQRFEVGYKRKSSSLYVINRSFKDFIYVNDINVLRNPEYIPGGNTGIARNFDSPGDVNLYPNPNKGMFILQLNNIKGTEKVSYSVYNLLAQKIYQGTVMLRNGSAEETVDISAYMPGIYILTVQAGDKQLVQKMVKE
jgi:photosystem II stability/assembly factor-like uncharacterized protein